MEAFGAALAAAAAEAGPAAGPDDGLPPGRGGHLLPEVLAVGDAGLAAAFRALLASPAARGPDAGRVFDVVGALLRAVQGVAAERDEMEGWALRLKSELQAEASKAAILREKLADERKGLADVTNRAGRELSHRREGSQKLRVERDGYKNKCGELDKKFTKQRGEMRKLEAEVHALRDRLNARATAAPARSVREIQNSPGLQERSVTLRSYMEKLRGQEAECERLRGRNAVLTKAVDCLKQQVKLAGAAGGDAGDGGGDGAADDADELVQELHAMVAADRRTGEFVDDALVLQRVAAIQGRLERRAAEAREKLSALDQLSPSKLSRTEQVLQGQLRQATGTIREQQQVIELALESLAMSAAPARGGPARAAAHVEAEKALLLQAARQIDAHRQYAADMLGELAQYQ